MISKIVSTSSLDNKAICSFISSILLLFTFSILALLNVSSVGTWEVPFEFAYWAIISIASTLCTVELIKACTSSTVSTSTPTLASTALLTSWILSSVTPTIPAFW